MYSLLHIFLGLLFGVREKHPINLIVFSLFTISLSTMIGLIYYYLTDNLFMVTMVGMVLMVGVIMGIVSVHWKHSHFGKPLEL